jgi:hypothetical protein
MTTPHKSPMGRVPRCPAVEHFPLITGFITPGSDFPRPHPLDASILMDVFDPTERISRGQYERIRVVEIDDPFLIEVNWCVCGAFAADLTGCWQLNFYLDDVDGVGPSSGPLGTTQTVDVSSAKPVPDPNNDDISKRCYTLQHTVLPNTVRAGAYSLLAVVTLRRGSCASPGPYAGDYLGYAQIPVMVFIPGE